MMTIELGDFPRRGQTIPRLDFRPLAQLPPALRAPRAAPRPRTAPVAAQDLDPLQVDALLRITVVKLDIKRVIAADARDLALVPFSTALAAWGIASMACTWRAMPTRTTRRE